MIISKDVLKGGGLAVVYAQAKAADEDHRNQNHQQQVGLGQDLDPQTVFLLQELLPSLDTPCALVVIHSSIPEATPRKKEI